jgi:tRNA dimethylallyltransferase
VAGSAGDGPEAPDGGTSAGSGDPTTPPRASPRPHLVVIAGPTATGKTDLSIRLALALVGEGTPAEVISADSRQVYRGMDVGTAKPTLAERRGVVHHAIDVVDPDAPFSVHDFVAIADRALASLAERGGMAILAGGTGLWIRAVASGIALDSVPHDPAIRAGIEAELLRDGVGPLADRLRRMAPLLAARTDLRNPRRVVRALEIAAVRGDGPLPPPTGYPGRLTWLGVDVGDRALHHAWIERRAVAQLGGGLPEEAARLRARYGVGLPSLSGIGYREAFDLLDGRVDRAGFLERNVARNTAFARRQRTWFRTESPTERLDPSAGDPLPRALEVVRRRTDPDA